MRLRLRRYGGGMRLAVVPELRMNQGATRIQWGRWSPQESSLSSGSRLGEEGVERDRLGYYCLHVLPCTYPKGPSGWLQLSLPVIPGGKGRAAAGAAAAAAAQDRRQQQSKQWQVEGGGTTAGGQQQAKGRGQSPGSSSGSGASSGGGSKGSAAAAAAAAGPAVGRSSKAKGNSSSSSRGAGGSRGSSDDWVAKARALVEEVFGPLGPTKASQQAGAVADGAAGVEGGQAGDGEGEAAQAGPPVRRLVVTSEAPKDRALASKVGEFGLVFIAERSSRHSVAVEGPPRDPLPCHAAHVVHGLSKGRQAILGLIHSHHALCVLIPGLKLLPCGPLPCCAGGARAGQGPPGHPARRGGPGDQQGGQGGAAGL